jgi:predicted CXXCH cytochrome family protein
MAPLPFSIKNARRIPDTNGIWNRFFADLWRRAAFRPRRSGANTLQWAALFLCCAAEAGAQRLPSSTPDVDSLHQKTCISAGCHQQPARASIPRHVPFLEGQCLSCHTDHASSVTLQLRPGGDALCLACHTNVERDTGAGGGMHATAGRGCTECHAPHESRVRGLLRGEEGLQQCAQCHEDFLTRSQEHPFRHRHFDPRTACGDCHYAHRGSDNHFLRANVAETCLTCHDLPIRSGDRPLENVAQALRTKPYRHAAMEQGGCPTCHTPHGSPQPSLLVGGYPASSYEGYRREDYALCWECHDPGLVENASGLGVTSFRNKETNLHRVHVVELKRGRACHLCHEPHASDVPHLLRSQVRFGQWLAPLTWTGSADGGQCASACHRDRPYTR